MFRCALKNFDFQELTRSNGLVRSEEIRALTYSTMSLQSVLILE